MYIYESLSITRCIYRFRARVHYKDVRMTLFWKFFQGLIWWQSDFFYNLDTLYIYDLWVFVNPVHLQIQSTSTLQGCVNDPFKEVLSRLDGKPWKDIDRVAAVKRYSHSAKSSAETMIPPCSISSMDKVWTIIKSPILTTVRCQINGQGWPIFLFIKDCFISTDTTSY